MDKRYFDTQDYDKLIHFQFPKVLMYGKEYEKLSNDAKLLYMVLFDLTKVSMQNHGRKDQYGNRMIWKDEKGFYIKCSLETIQKIIGCGRTKSVNLKKELDEFNLLEEKRQGQGNANLLYVKKLKYDETDIYTINDMEDDLHSRDQEKEKEEPQTHDTHEKFGKRTSRSSESVPLEVRKSDPIKNYSSNNKSIKNKNLNHNHKRAEIENVLWNLEIPQGLKIRIKTAMQNNSIDLLPIENILEIEDAYNYQLQNMSIVPDCDDDNIYSLNDKQFINTVIKMFESMKGQKIGSIRGLIDKWIKTGLDYLSKQYLSIEGVHKENDVYYDWLNG